MFVVYYMSLLFFVSSFFLNFFFFHRRINILYTENHEKLITTLVYRLCRLCSLLIVYGIIYYPDIGWLLYIHPWLISPRMRVRIWVYEGVPTAATRVVKLFDDLISVEYCIILYRFLSVIIFFLLNVFPMVMIK